MKDYLNQDVRGKINAKEVIIGKGVVVEEGVIISGNGGPAEKVILGDFSFIGQNTKIFAPEFRLGDYSKLHNYSFGHGVYPLQIGRNCWIGGNTVLDSQGGLDIDDNVGIGAHSQIWTHAQFGDIVEGSRFYSKKYMHIQKDAWLVGHCIVSPVNVGEKSMAMVGSVITRDMEPNHIYGGSPAKDLTDKLGYQFEERTIQEKESKLQELIDQFYLEYPEFNDSLVITRGGANIDDDLVYFDLTSREYTKKYLSAEIAFMKKFVPLVKFTAFGEKSFIEIR